MLVWAHTSLDILVIHSGTSMDVGTARLVVAFPLSCMRAVIIIITITITITVIIIIVITIVVIITIIVITISMFWSLDYEDRMREYLYWREAPPCSSLLPDDHSSHLVVHHNYHHDQ